MVPGEGAGLRRAIELCGDGGSRGHRRRGLGMGLCHRGGNGTVPGGVTLCRSIVGPRWSCVGEGGTGGDGTPCRSSTGTWMCGCVGGVSWRGDAGGC